MVPSFLSRLRRRNRLDTIDGLVDFLRAQAMQTAQTSLTTYLKGRMGTGWPKYFSDPAYATQISNAQQQGYLICLADLAVYAVIRISPDAVQPDITALALFLRVTDGSADEIIQARLSNADWTSADAAFAPSIATLIDLAPVAPSFRQADRAAFENALTLRWASVRATFKAHAVLHRLADKLPELTAAKR